METRSNRLPQRLSCQATAHLLPKYRHYLRLSGLCLAVLVDDRWLGILETPAQNGVFRINPGLSQAAGTQTYPAQGVSAVQAPNRYLVVTPKSSSAQILPGDGKLARPLALDDADGKSCITEFWTVNHCWRNPEGSVYVFWESNVPGNLKDQEFLSIIDTIKTITAMMRSYQQKGFTAAAISPGNPAYIIIEAGAKTAYYSWKTGNVYVPWDIIGSIGNSGNRCTLAHEYFHWIEDEEYRMGVAALSGPKSWWLENSAENGAFLIDSICIDRTLTEYGKTTTSGNVLGFQAAPMLWDTDEEARYIHALQLYLSICDGGANCALSEAAWIQAINSGSYPMEGGALTAYQNNAKDLGRFLLGSPPAESRSGAVIPPSALSGKNFGDYLALQTSTRDIWDFGLTMNQFTRASGQQVKVLARIDLGGVYPLWVSNGTGTPMGAIRSNTGLPGLLEIQAGPAFWLKLDQAEPVFYPAGTSLKLGPISNRLGIGTARIVAIAPDAGQTFEASLSLADFSGDWSALIGPVVVTPVDCSAYTEGDLETYPGDSLLQIFSAYGTYVKDPEDPQNENLIWEGTFPEEWASASVTGSSEVTVSPDNILLHYRLDIPEPTSASILTPWFDESAQVLTKEPVLRRSNLLSGLSFLPMSAGVAWLHSRRRKLARLALVIQLALVAFWLSSCLGSCDMKIWGTIDATYAFKNLEYIDPGQAAAGATGSEGSQPAILWKLSNGALVNNWDLTFSVESTDEQGVTTEDVTVCKLAMTSSAATGTIGPEDSVVPPDMGE